LTDDTSVLEQSAGRDRTFCRIKPEIGRPRTKQGSWKGKKKKKKNKKGKQKKKKGKRKKKKKKKKNSTIGRGKKN